MVMVLSRHLSIDSVLRDSGESPLQGEGNRSAAGAVKDLRLNSVCVTAPSFLLLSHSPRQNIGQSLEDSCPDGKHLESAHNVPSCTPVITFTRHHLPRQVFLSSF